MKIIMNLSSEITMQDLYDLDINEIEKITVLKDASATALYGSKAANGVIVITRKPILESTLRVQYNFCRAPHHTSLVCRELQARVCQGIEADYQVYDWLGEYARPRCQPPQPHSTSRRNARVYLAHSDDRGGVDVLLLPQPLPHQTHTAHKQRAGRLLALQNAIRQQHCVPRRACLAARPHRFTDTEASLSRHISNYR